MIPVIKSTYSNGPLHRTLMSTDLSARVVLPKQTLSPNSSRGQLLHSSLELDCLYLVCRAIFARKNDPRNMGKSLTDCLSGAVQVTSVLPSFFTSPTSFTVHLMYQACRANPTYQYVEMGRVNLNEMPPRLARSSFTDGYFCELRVQVIVVIVLDSKRNY